MIWCTELDEDLEDSEEKIQCLTMGIPDISIDDLPRWYQHHTVRVLSYFERILHRVARAMMCYHEHNHED